METDKPRLKTVLAARAIAVGISAAAVVALAAGLAPAAAQTAKDTTRPTDTIKAQAETPFTEAQKKAIEGLIRDYLTRNPDILIEMTNELQRKQAEAQQQNLKSAIAENTQALFHAKHGTVVGNPKGNVTIVEFFDYNCGYCKRAFPELLKLIKGDGNVRVVLKEFPIFGERSVGAAKVAIAAKHQDKHFDLHAALLQHNGPVNEAVALKIAEKVGLDMAKLKADMEKPEVQGIIDENRELAEKLGIQGTPFYLVGDRPIPGAPDDLYELFVGNVAEVRKNGCAVAC